MIDVLKRRILLVDDDQDVLATLGSVLTAAGYEIIPASSGAHAVRIWRELKGGDLVIVDLFMPEKNGLETILELRAFSPGVPIIAISGVSGPLELLEDAKLLGAVATLQKPFSNRALLGLVATTLANTDRDES